MKAVFADTSYFVALLSKADACHELAVEWSQKLLGRQFVTEYVLVEVGSALARTKDRRLYVTFVEHLLADPDTVFILASGSLFRRGLRLFQSRPDKGWSLVDCVGYALPNVFGAAILVEGGWNIIVFAYYAVKAKRS
jgi:uncharacterized protein